MPSDSARNSIEKRRPSTTTLELGVASVQGSVASSTGVSARFRVFIVDPCSSTFGALLPQDLELTE